MFKRRKSKEVVARLRDVAFFEGFTDSELEKVAALVEETTAEQGAELMDQGRPGLECYVIVEGEASVLFAGEHVATLGPGSMVGEMALIDHRPRSASVVADTPMSLMALDARSFRTMLDEMPRASQKVMALLNARLRENRERTEEQ